MRKLTAIAHVTLDGLMQSPGASRLATCFARGEARRAFRRAFAAQLAVFAAAPSGSWTLTPGR